MLIRVLAACPFSGSSTLSAAAADRAAYAPSATLTGTPAHHAAAKCSASSAATWTAACSGSQCEAPSSSVQR